jgi:signal transduction histidine kinase
VDTFASADTDASVVLPAQRTASRSSSGAAADPPAIAPAALPDGRRSQIRHDILHELGTIMLLASVVGSADDVGPTSRGRTEQILSEARWLERLLRAYDDAQVPIDDRDWSPPPERIRVDALTGTVVGALRLATVTPVTLAAEEAWANAESLSLWRALRNVLDNAVRVAGPDGRVLVRVCSEADWIVVQVDDDGPGFGAGSSRLGSLGLGIVQDFTDQYGGSLEIRRSEFGGACVRMLLPAAPPAAHRTRTGPGGDEAAAL